MRNLIALAALFCSFGATASDWRIPINPISTEEPCSIVLPATRARPEITIKVEYGPEPNQIRTYEHLVVSARPSRSPHRGLRAATLRVESSYGIFRLFVADLTGDGVEEVVLILGTGRGPSARAEYLHVYRWEGSALREILEVPYSDWFGSSSRWAYTPGFTADPVSSRIFLSLALEQHEGAEDPLAVPELVPAEKLLTFQWDSTIRMLVKVKR